MAPLVHFPAIPPFCYKKKKKKKTKISLPPPTTFRSLSIIGFFHTANIFGIQYLMLHTHSPLFMKQTWIAYLTLCCMFSSKVIEQKTFNDLHKST